MMGVRKCMAVAALLSFLHFGACILRFIDHCFFGKRGVRRF